MDKLQRLRQAVAITGAILTLIGNILESFSNLPRPEPTKIANRKSLATSQEALEVEQFFKPYEWKFVDWSLMTKYDGDQKACLYFMSDEAFLYYYPAYMIMTLHDPANRCGLLHPVASIACGHEEKQDLFQLMQSGYNMSQKRCVGRFLLNINEHFVMRYGDMNLGISPKEAAERYWLAN